MRISPVSNNKILFKRYFTTGYDASSLSHILEPYSEQLNKITDGFDVEIKTGEMLYLHDMYHDEMVETYPTSVKIEPSVNSAYYSVPKMEIQVNHEPNPCIGPDYEANDIIAVIKKGIHFIKQM